MTAVMIHTPKYMTSVITPQAPPFGPSAPPSAADALELPAVEVTVATASVADTEAVLAMVARCSPTTLSHRFHGPSDGVAHTRAVLQGRPGDETLAAWNDSVCVGLATLADDEQGTAHLGVLVEDAWQRRRVGSTLVAALVAGAAARGISTVRADVLGEDRFMLRVLRRIGPSTVSFGLGTFTAHIDLRGH